MIAIRAIETHLERQVLPPMARVWRYFAFKSETACSRFVAVAAKYFIPLLRSKDSPSSPLARPDAIRHQCKIPTSSRRPIVGFCRGTWEDWFLAQVRRRPRIEGLSRFYPPRYNMP